LATSVNRAALGRSGTRPAAAGAALQEPGGKRCADELHKM
jgi:hypothetical protein